MIPKDGFVGSALNNSGGDGGKGGTSAFARLGGFVAPALSTAASVVGGGGNFKDAARTAGIGFASQQVSNLAGKAGVNSKFAGMAGAAGTYFATGGSLSELGDAAKKTGINFAANRIAGQFGNNNLGGVVHSAGTYLAGGGDLGDFAKGYGANLAANAATNFIGRALPENGFVGQALSGGGPFFGGQNTGGSPFALASFDTGTNGNNGGNGGLNTFVSGLTGGSGPQGSLANSYGAFTTLASMNYPAAGVGYGVNVASVEGHEQRRYFHYAGVEEQKMSRGIAPYFGGGSGGGVFDGVGGVTDALLAGAVGGMPQGGGQGFFTTIANAGLGLAAGKINSKLGGLAGEGFAGTVAANLGGQVLNAGFSPTQQSVLGAAGQLDKQFQFSNIGT